MEQDEIVYRSGSIIVSKTLARFGEVTYPVNGIGSVFILPPNRVVSIIAGIISAFFGAVFALNPDDRILSIGLFVLVAFFAFLAWTKPHKLMLRTASGDQQAYESVRKADLLKIKAAIERAVVLRG